MSSCALKRVIELSWRSVTCSLAVIASAHILARIVRFVIASPRTSFLAERFRIKCPLSSILRALPLLYAVALASDLRHLRRSNLFLLDLSQWPTSCTQSLHARLTMISASPSVGKLLTRDGRSASARYCVLLLIIIIFFAVFLTMY